MPKVLSLNVTDGGRRIRTASGPTASRWQLEEDGTQPVAEAVSTQSRTRSATACRVSLGLRRLTSRDDFT